MREKMGEMQAQIQEFVATLNRELVARNARPAAEERNCLVPVINARLPHGESGYNSELTSESRATAGYVAPFAAYVGLMALERALRLPAAVDFPHRASSSPSS